jgi:ATP-grasp domain
MRTAIVISTRGFAVFDHGLLVDPRSVRLVGIFSELDVGNLTESQRQYFNETHVVPCGLRHPSPMMCSLVDADAARAAISRVLERTPVEETSILCYDEQNMLVAAQLRTEFGTAGPKLDDILPFRDKFLMKEKLMAKNVRVPKFGTYDANLASNARAAYFEALRAEVGVPFILKPTDSAGGEGVYRVGSWDEFAALPADLGRAYEYEEFVAGTMYSVNILSKDRQTIFGGVTEYLVNSLQVQEGRVNADINLIDSDRRVSRMVRFAETALDALGWPDGASHLELFHTNDDELVFLEVAARFKGMAGLAAMQRHYGVAFVNTALEIETGVESRPYDGEQVYCFDGVIPKVAGVVDHLVAPDIESACDITWKVAPGDRIDQSNSLIANAGTFLVWNADYDTLYRDFQRLARYQPIRYRASTSTRERVAVAAGEGHGHA